MILLFNNNLEFLGELSKNELISATDEIELNGKIKSDISIPYENFNKDTSYFGYAFENQGYLYKVVNKKINDGVVALEGIHSFFDDMKGRIIRDKRPTNLSLKVICNDVFQDTDWIFNSTVQGLMSTTFYHISYLEAFYQLIELFNCEFKLNIEFQTGRKPKKTVELKQRISGDYGKWYEYGDNLISVIAEQNYSDIATAFIGRGKGIETGDGYGRKLKFDNIEWKIANGNPADKPLGQDFIEIKSATYQYGYDGLTPRIVTVDFDNIEDSETLLQKTYEYAIENSRPKLQLKSKAYSSDVIEVGEIAAIIRSDIEIRYKTRIFNLKRDLISGVKDFEFGDKIVQSIPDLIRGAYTENKKTTSQLISVMEDRLSNVNATFWTTDSYDIDLLPGNEYGLPSGRYSFDKPIDQEPTQVTYMGAGKVLIADGKTTDGTWNFRTAITPEGIIGDEVVTGTVTANKLSSDVGQMLDISSNESIRNLVTNSEYNENQELINQRFSEVIQTGSNLEISISEIISKVNENKALTDNEFEFIKTYFNFASDGLEIGKTSSEMTLKLLNDRISFLDNGNEVAYISDNKLEIFDGNFMNSLGLGRFEFVPRESGNLSFRLKRN